MVERPKPGIPLVDLIPDASEEIASLVLLTSDNADLDKLLQGDPEDENIGLLPNNPEAFPQKKDPKKQAPKTTTIDYGKFDALMGDDTANQAPLLPSAWAKMQNSLKADQAEKAASQKGKKDNAKVKGVKNTTKKSKAKGKGKKKAKAAPTKEQIFLKREHSKAYHNELKNSVDTLGLSIGKAKEYAQAKGKARTELLRRHLASGEINVHEYI